MDFVAFDFGGTRGRCCLAQADGRFQDLVTLERRAGENGEQWLARLLSAGAALRPGQGTIRAVACSFGGPVSPDGRVLSIHVQGWEKVDLKDRLAEHFGAPVFIENDANAGALGENRFGAGRGTKFMAYLTVSTGIGGGVILDGRLYRGAHGFAAEFGHTVLLQGPGVPQYAAGKPGVLEALASGPAIAREGKAALESFGRSAPANFSAKDVFDAAGRGETWAVGVRDRALSHLARGVASVCCAFDVERVVIGGGVAMAGDMLFQPLREKVREFLPHFLEGKSDIVPAALGDQAPILGAVAAAAEALRERG